MTETLIAPTPRSQEDNRPGAVADTVDCPECGQPATVEWRTQIGSTCGALEHVKISCADRHRFFMPTHMLVDVRRRSAP